MKIEIKPLLEGAKSAKGTAVIIDVINASSTIVECLEQGAKEVVPISTLKEAVKIKGSEDLICGEMKNFKIKPDFYNSPYSASSQNLKNRRVIIKTEAGTKGILGARKADEVVLGCFLNCSAVVSYLKRKNPKAVTLVPMGDYGKTKNIEDGIFAEYLKNLLENKKPENFGKLKAKIKWGSLRNIFRNVFLHGHLEAALKIDTSVIVPKLVNGKIVKS